jgi:hypothetical protein
LAAAPVAAVAPTYFFAPKGGWSVPGKDYYEMTWGDRGILTWAANRYAWCPSWSSKTPEQILADIKAITDRMPKPYYPLYGDGSRSIVPMMFSDLRDVAPNYKWIDDGLRKSEAGRRLLSL